MIPGYFFNPILEMLKDLQRIARSVRAVDMNDVIKKVIDMPAVNEEIIALNQHQLYDQGVDAKGEPTGEYSLATIYGTSTFEGKIEKGQPYDHITLRDTGESYDSMEVVTEADQFIVTGDFPEAIERSFPDAKGLTDESKTKLKPIIKAHALDVIRQKILK